MSLPRSGSGELFFRKKSSENLTTHLLHKEDSVSEGDGGFYSKYEPKEVLGRYVLWCTISF